MATPAAGTAVVKGGITTFLGILLLAGASSDVAHQAMTPRETHRTTRLPRSDSRAEAISGSTFAAIAIQL